ncbi:discoidin domain-containing protein [Shewanella sp. HL-SH8]|uniref:discoidin domain-containing protein n=1 Tax=Shewanella sp. HL-SH8 TaxID=3436242 RepID=UPI003EBF38B5
MELKKTTLGLFLMVLAGCGGSEESSIPEAEQPTLQRNLASKDNGATIEASYDAQNAKLLIDNDILSSAYWSPNVSGDFFVIDFGQISHVSSIELFAEPLIWESNFYTIEVSTDKINWTKTWTMMNQPGVIQCSQFKMGPSSGSMKCTFDRDNALYGPDARYLKITMTSPKQEDISRTLFKEIIVDGK